MLTMMTSLALPLACASGKAAGFFVLLPLFALDYATETLKTYAAYGPLVLLAFAGLIALERHLRHRRRDRRLAREAEEAEARPVIRVRRIIKA